MTKLTALMFFLLLLVFLPAVVAKVVQSGGGSSLAAMTQILALVDVFALETLEPPNTNPVVASQRAQSSS